MIIKQSFSYEEQGIESIFQRKIHLALHLMEVDPSQGKGYFQHACCAFLASS